MLRTILRWTMLLAALVVCQPQARAQGKTVKVPFTAHVSGSVDAGVEPYQIAEVAAIDTAGTASLLGNDLVLPDSFSLTYYYTHPDSAASGGLRVKLGSRSGVVVCDATVGDPGGSTLALTWPDESGMMTITAHMVNIGWSLGGAPAVPGGYIDVTINVDTVGSTYTLDATGYLLLQPRG